MKHSVLVPVNKLNRGVTVNRCWQSDEMKDSHPILEQTDSDPAAMRLFKVVHNQAITVTDLVLSVGERKKTTAECEMGATNTKVVHFWLHLFHASCLLSSPESALLLVTAEHQDSGVCGREWFRYFTALHGGEGVGVGNCCWGSNDI